MDTFQPKVILVATDFSKTAAHALRYASSLAERTGARLVVIYADELIPPLGETAVEASLATRMIGELISEAQEKLIAHVEANVSPYVPFDARMIVDSTVSSIVHEAKESDADLVVMGTHGRTGVRRLLIGSVCESVMRAVSSPVLVV